MCPAFNNQYICIFTVFRMILTVTSVNQLIFVMVKCGVFFAVRTELLIIFRRATALKG
jgi:hypothetical protein